MTPIANILHRLKKVKYHGDGSYTACCPAHDDKSPSLSIRELKDGTILLHCFAGCPPAEVIESIGFEMSDLFPPQTPYEKAQYYRKRHINTQIEQHSDDALLIAIAKSYVERGEPIPEDEKPRLQEALDRHKALGGQHD